MKTVQVMHLLQRLRPQTTLELAGEAIVCFKILVRPEE